jgi:hypothetical protein
MILVGSTAITPAVATLVTFLEQAADSIEARGYAERLSQLESGNAEVSRMLKELKEHSQG